MTATLCRLCDEIFLGLVEYVEGLSKCGYTSTAMA